jgi:hypothetical protein
MSERGGPLQVRVLVVALWIVGIGGVIAALGSLDEPNWGGPGLCLVASALAFGQLLNALIRK